jgi:hypothetical protein
MPNIALKNSDCQECGCHAPFRCPACRTGYCKNHVLNLASHRESCNVAPEQPKPRSPKPSRPVTGPSSSLPRKAAVDGQAQGHASASSSAAIAESARSPQPQPADQKQSQKQQKGPKVIPKAPELTTEGGSFAASAILAHIERHDPTLNHGILAVFRTRESDQMVLRLHCRRVSGSLEWVLIGRTRTIIDPATTLTKIRKAIRSALITGDLRGFQGGEVVWDELETPRALDRESVVRELARAVSEPGGVPGVEVQLQNWTRRSEKGVAKQPGKVCGRGSSFKDEDLRRSVRIYLALSERPAKGPAMSFLAEEPGTVVAVVDRE